MGENKNLFTEQEKLDPPPAEIDIQTGTCMWIINGSKVWAENYTRALELLPFIESFD